MQQSTHLLALPQRLSQLHVDQLLRVDLPLDRRHVLRSSPTQQLAATPVRLVHLRLADSATARDQIHVLLLHHLEIRRYGLLVLLERLSVTPLAFTHQRQSAQRVFERPFLPVRSEQRRHIARQTEWNARRVHDLHATPLQHVVRVEVATYHGAAVEIHHDLVRMVVRTAD